MTGLTTYIKTIARIPSSETPAASDEHQATRTTAPSPAPAVNGSQEKLEKVSSSDQVGAKRKRLDDQDAQSSSSKRLLAAESPALNPDSNLEKTLKDRGYVGTTLLNLVPSPVVCQNSHIRPESITK